MRELEEVVVEVDGGIGEEVDAAASASSIAAEAALATLRRGSEDVR